jgi:hypothetical protein
MEFDEGAFIASTAARAEESAAAAISLNDGASHVGWNVS